MEFSLAKITNSRLMGSMGLIIKWEIDNKTKLEQYFLLDAEGLGIADYVSLKNPTKLESYKEEERLMGGLGSDRMRLTEEQALFLVQFYGNKNKIYGKELPGDIKEYIDIIEEYKTQIKIEDIFPIICKNIESDIEFINYMTMRLIAWDRESLKYFSDREEISNMNITKINGTLLKNTVIQKDENKYLSKAIYEDEDGYYSCIIAFNISNIDNKYKINSMLVSDIYPVYDFEVFDEISKEEYVSIYKLKNAEEFLSKMYDNSPFLLVSEIDENIFMTRFNFNNNHVNKDVYVINNDIKAIYYQMKDNFYVGTYSNRDRVYINKMLMCNYKEHLTQVEDMYFDENVLYDFVESGSDDFHDFLD